MRRLLTVTGVDVSFYQGQSPDGEVFAKTRLANGHVIPKAELIATVRLATGRFGGPAESSSLICRHSRR
jgi:hypothetical protein